MKVTQIAPILNAVYGTLLGGETIPNPSFNPELEESPSNVKTIPNPNLFKEDLSNVADVGYQITSSSDWGNNFDKYVGKIIDKVGRTIFRDRVYSADSLGLRREEMDYGSVLEKIRVEVGEFKINRKWNMVGQRTEGGVSQNYGSVLPDGTPVSGGPGINPATGKAYVDYSHLFDFDEPAEVDALYFNILDTYKLTICIPRDQMEGAFRSAGDMQRFFGMITNRIMTKFEVALEALDEAAESNFVGAKISYDSNVVDLKAAWIATLPSADQSTYSSATAEELLANKEFLRYCVRRIKTDKKLMAKFSGKYNHDNYGTFTPGDRLKVFALTDFATAMETVLMSDTYHNNFVTLEGYKEVPYWQASSDDSFESRSAIVATVVTAMDGLGKKGTTADVNRTGIVFVMQDYDAVMTGSKQMDVDNLYNPDGRFWKYFYGHDMKFYNDLSENGIIYTIGTAEAPAGAPVGGTLKLAKGSNSGDTKVATGTAITGAASYSGGVVDAPVAVTAGASAPTSLNTSITVGTTTFAATAGKYLQIVALDSNSKAIGTTWTVVTADVIK